MHLGKIDCSFKIMLYGKLKMVIMLCFGWTLGKNYPHYTQRINFAPTKNTSRI
jgi:hypothetical protein